MNTQENETRVHVFSAAERALSLSGRFRLYGKWADREGYLQIGDLFRRAGGYASEHAALLLELANGMHVPDTAQNLTDALRRLQDAPYASFAASAKEAQMPETGELFTLLAHIEAAQSRCFSLLLENLRQQTAFDKPTESYWVCRVCGMICRGTHAPQACPVCAMPKESFSLYMEDY